MFVERDHMLGYSLQKQILEGMPHHILGANPSLPQATKARDWEALKQAYRRNRLFLNTTVEAFEDGYNLAMLEAMATGMPVVSIANATSPIRDGENGFISADIETLRGRVESLLADKELALDLGLKGRQTVADTFPMDVFVTRWNEIFEACLSNYSGHSHPAQNQKEGDAVKLRFERNDLYLYSWDDVSTFLSVGDTQRVCVPKVKLDRVGNSFLCELTLYNQDRQTRMVWQGLEVHRSLDQSVNIVWPEYLKDLDGEVREQVEMILRQSVKEVTDRGLEEGMVNITLQEIDGFEANAGEDVATLGDSPSAILLQHAKRYLFARQFCNGKKVVDFRCGSGYGTRILSGAAEKVTGLEFSDQSIAFASGAHSHNSVRYLEVAEWRSGLEEGESDVVVCFDFPKQGANRDDFIEEAKRILNTGGRLIVSIPTGRSDLDAGSIKSLFGRHFAEVEVYGQMSPQPGDDYFRMFDFKGVADANDEALLAVCILPIATSGVDGQGVEPDERSTAATPDLNVNVGCSDAIGKRILFGYTSNPISAGTNYVEALRKDHEVLTCGPMLDAETLAEWREAEAQHALKPSGAGKPEKLDLIKRLAKPCDIPLPKGQVDIAELLSALPAGWLPDLFIWFDSGPDFMPLGIEKLDFPAACLVGDTHTGQMKWRQEYARQFEDVFLMYNRPNIPDFRAAGCEKVHWLPGACDPRSHGMIQAEKAYDIGFVGQTHKQWHPDRVRLLERLIRAGHDVHIESKILEEMSLFYSRSRIVFNRSLNGDLNRRVFEALCSGSMLLTDRLPEEVGLEMLFKDREHLVLYTEDNLEELAEYYLRNEGEREEIARMGREFVLSEHTFENRAAKVMETVFGSCESRGGANASVARANGLAWRSQPRVSIVIPLFNQVDHTTACLDALKRTVNGTPHQLILVDNGSSDGTRALLDSLGDDVEVVLNDENLGFARGNNVGAARAEGEYLLFLNNDTIPHDGWLDALLLEADSGSDVGVVGPKLVYPDTGRIQHAGLELVNGVPDHVHRHVDADDPAVNRARDLDMVTGACLMIRRTLFEGLDGFDDGYVNGVEDVDLCLRARDAGYRVRYCPSSVLDHFEGTSEGRFDHVRPNLERFVGRWNGRFDGEGKFVPKSVVESTTDLRGCWEGTQFVYHSLSLVNMALTSELIRSGACELQVIPYEPAAFGPDVDPDHYNPIAERIGAPLTGPAQFHVRHQW
ncbi:MAG TPA: hypothetical protein DIU35_20345, partial [Candidatus Latescibacteria bacterium]|nr:hypothetical protein [Candidatus Latescibacterota bacterium]